MTQNGAMSDAPELPDPHVLGPGLLPTPFTADEIRAGTASGRTIRLLVEEPEGERYERVSHLTECDDEGATLERWRIAADGGIDGEVARARVTWLELQEHAAFPADRTSVSSETLELPIGRVECLRYDTRVDESADAAAARFWFSPVHQGMPVRYEVSTPAGVQRTTMVAVEMTP